MYVQALRSITTPSDSCTLMLAPKCRESWYQNSWQVGFSTSWPNLELLCSDSTSQPALYRVRVAMLFSRLVTNLKVLCSAPNQLVMSTSMRVHICLDFCSQHSRDLRRLALPIIRWLSSRFSADQRLLLYTCTAANSAGTILTCPSC